MKYVVEKSTFEKFGVRAAAFSVASLITLGFHRPHGNQE